MRWNEHLHRIDGIPKRVLFLNLSEGRRVLFDAAQRRIGGLVLRRLEVNLGSSGLIQTQPFTSWATVLNMTKSITSLPNSSLVVI